MAILMGLIAVERGVGMPSLPARTLSNTSRSDLVVNSLCMSGENLVQAEVQNRGTGSDPGEFEIEFNDIRGGEGMDASMGKVPAPGQSTYVVLDQCDQPERRKDH